MAQKSLEDLLRAVLEGGVEGARTNLTDRKSVV